MEIQNGYGSLDTLTGKYITSKMDITDSKTLIKKYESEVSQLLEKKFGCVIRNKEAGIYYNKYTEQSTAYLWTPQIAINTNNVITNRSGFVHVNTGINSNGYNGQVVKRHFVISFELNGLIRPKYHKHWNEATLLKAYILNDNWQDTIDEFRFWLNSEFDTFIAETI